MKQFDELDISSSVPDGLVHVDKPRLGPTCRRLGIEYAKAIVGWKEFRRQGQWNRHPYTSGVVVHLADHARLLAAIAAKKVKESKTVATLPVLAALFTLIRRSCRNWNTCLLASRPGSGRNCCWR